MELNLPNENTCPYADIQCTDCDMCWVRFIEKEPTPPKGSEQMKTMSGYSPENISKEECRMYLSSWAESMQDKINQGDPRARIFKERIIFLKRALGIMAENVPTPPANEISSKK